MNSKNKILVIDDSKSVANHIQSLLTPHYTVRAVYSGEEALEILQSFMPDLILLDTIMTGIDGYEVCRRIRENGSFGLMKIIMISSRKKLKERIMGYEAGIDDHLGKPFEPEELLAKVKVFLRLKAVENQLYELNAKLNDQVKIRTAQLLDAEKMAALGRHAAGIVHNLNNPLQTIMGITHILAMDHPESRNILSLEKAALQMRNIISMVLTTSCRQNQEHMTEIDLNQAVQEQVEMLKSNPFFKHKIQVKMDLGKVPLFTGIYIHFSQCLANLLKNGAEAMYASNPRQLTVSSRYVNNEITISISDTGTGISKETMKKLFDPFFSTKPLVSTGDTPTGTGLGLAYCKEIIESYGGRILVDSKLNEGSKFTIQIPAKNCV